MHGRAPRGTDAAIRTITLISIVCLVAGLAACGILDRVGLQTDPPNVNDTAGGGTGTLPFASTVAMMVKLGWLASLVGLAGTVASFFVPIIPRKAAMVSIALGIGSTLVADFFRGMGRPLMWVLFALVLIAIACACWPMVGAYLNLRKTGKSLIAQGDTRAGTALLAVSSRKYNKHRKSIAKGLDGPATTIMATADRFKLPVPKPTKPPEIPQAIADPQP